jgi:Flp pilus assembly protein TadD
LEDAEAWIGLAASYDRLRRALWRDRRATGPTVINNLQLLNASYRFIERVP